MTQSTAILLVIPGAVILIALYYGWRTFTDNGGPRVSLGIGIWIVLLMPVILSIVLIVSSHALLVYQTTATDLSGFEIRKCHYFTGKSLIVRESMRLHCPDWEKM